MTNNVEPASGYGSIPQPVKIVNYEAVDPIESSATAPRLSQSAQRTIGVSVAAFLLFALSGQYTATQQPQLPLMAMTAPEEAVEIGPIYYDDQLVNHFDANDQRKWSHPYWISDTHFEGPGHPIFVIIGGEGPVTKILYPYVTKKLAPEFGGYVLQTEHRFYGASQPVGDFPSNQQMKDFLSPELALADWIRLIRYLQGQLGCSYDRASPDYCPVVTIGGSYPGFLSAMMRFVYPDVVDIGYASSAPLILYEHEPDFDTNAYFDFVSEVAEDASKGCVHGYKHALKDLSHWILKNSDKEPVDLAHELGICKDTFPAYIDSHELLVQELTFLAAASNADFNMEYYPPSKETDLVKGCRIFSKKHHSAQEKYAKFLQLKQGGEDYDSGRSLCYDLTTEMPGGPNSTLSSADWSGAGDGETGRMWEFQICKDLVVKTGFAGKHSMFYPKREWTLEWLTQKCQSRFEVTPQPGRMRDMWGYDKLIENGASNILFTNGGHDGWFVSSYTKDLSDTVVALNFPNGAHHSDLLHEWPVPGQTKDITKGHDEIVEILRGWLNDVGAEN